MNVIVTRLSGAVSKTPKRSSESLLNTVRRCLSQPAASQPAASQTLHQRQVMRIG